MTKDAFLALYLRCFPEDTAQDALQVWQLAKSGKILHHETAGQPVAMLVLLPAVLRAETPCTLYYIFAACTHPEFRRRGIMDELLHAAYDTAITDGRQGVFLRPANQALAQYYAKRNFAVFSRYQTETLTANPTAGAFSSLSFLEFSKRRAALLPTPYIEWAPDFLQTNFSYCTAYADKENLLICETQGDTLCIRECFGPSANTFAATVAAQLGCSKILCRRFGSGAPYAMAHTATPLPETYVGLTLDVF
ncbi:MAG: GNAT family N-acetyltransferase [Clostridia bacterium]|nr:GNAT family N-acetyltransferase [Clostridia bacterium]